MPINVNKLSMVQISSHFNLAGHIGNLKYISYVKERSLKSLTFH